MGDSTATASNPDTRLDTRVALERRRAREQEEDLALEKEGAARQEHDKDDYSTERAKRVVRELESIERESWRILKEGNPFQFFLDVFMQDHEGDLTAARCIALVFASSSVANGDGLHCYLSGSSGRGKTHAAECMFRQLPDEFRYTRSFSDKYLFYAGNDRDSGLKPGVVILLDDQTMSEGTQEIFKVAVSKYSHPEGVVYGSVLSQKAITLRMPNRISWVLLKVDDPGDDQVMNRIIQARIQETEDKIKDSAKKIQEKYKDLKKKSIVQDRRDIRIARAIWLKIKIERVAVEVPCAGHVIFADYENLRNHELFFNLLMAHAVIHRWQRKEIGRTEDDIPIIEATYDDYREAQLIFEALYSFGGQQHNTLKNEDLVVDALLDLNPENGIFTLKEVVDHTGLSYYPCYRALHGRKGGSKSTETLGGLLEKCPYIRKAGKRGRHETETEMEYSQKGGVRSEISRREHFNDDIYLVNVTSLRDWKYRTEPVRLDPRFKREGWP